MNGWWVTRVLENQGPVVLAAWIGWVIVSIVLHELAHGWMAIRCGDRTPIDRGHWTLNPIVHMGWFSLLVFALVGIAWGAMPVDPARLRRRHDDALVAVAGPAMNLLLALLCLVGLVASIALIRFAGPSFLPDILTHAAIIFDIGLFLNLALALFNLLPVPPLDGSRIVASYVEPYRRLLSTEAGRAIAVVLIIVMMSRAGSYVFTAGRFLADQAAFGLLHLVLPPPSPAASPATNTP
ncbi:MAG: site-2 protease family protein [Phycisphaerales bacterium]